MLMRLPAPPVVRLIVLMLVAADETVRLSVELETEREPMGDAAFVGSERHKQKIFVAALG